MAAVAAEVVAATAATVEIDGNAPYRLTVALRRDFYQGSPPYKGGVPVLQSGLLPF
jgi:hypothetical protein